MSFSKEIIDINRKHQIQNTELYALCLVCQNCYVRKQLSNGYINVKKNLKNQLVFQAFSHFEIDNLYIGRYILKQGELVCIFSLWIKGN